jgi:hypothetical protein
MLDCGFRIAKIASVDLARKSETSHNFRQQKFVATPHLLFAISHEI